MAPKYLLDGYLRQAGYLSDEDAGLISRASTDPTLFVKNFLTISKIAPEKLAQYIGQMSRWPVHLEDLVPEPEAIGLLPKPIMQEFEVVPLEKTRSKLVVAMIDPFEPGIFEKLKFFAGKKISAIVTTPDRVEKFLVLQDSSFKPKQATVLLPQPNENTADSQSLPDPKSESTQDPVDDDRGQLSDGEIAAISANLAIDDSLADTIDETPNDSAQAAAPQEETQEGTGLDAALTDDAANVTSSGAAPDETVPDSGDEIADEDDSVPDSGDEIADEDDAVPDSGDEIADEDDSVPDSGDEIAGEDDAVPDSGDEIADEDDAVPDSGDEIADEDDSVPDSGDEVAEAEPETEEAADQLVAVAEDDAPPGDEFSGMVDLSADLAALEESEKVAELRRDKEEPTRPKDLLQDAEDLEAVFPGIMSRLNQSLMGIASQPPDQAIESLKRDLTQAGIASGLFFKVTDGDIELQSAYPPETKDIWSNGTEAVSELVAGLETEWQSVDTEGTELPKEDAYLWQGKRADDQASLLMWHNALDQMPGFQKTLDRVLRQLFKLF